MLLRTTGSSGQVERALQPQPSEAVPATPGAATLPRLRPWQSILLAVDFSSESAAALRQAVRLASGVGAKLHPLHVLDPLVCTRLEERLEATHYSKKRMMPELQSRWREYLQANGLSDVPELELELDDVNKGVLRRARLSSADLITLGACEPSSTGTRLSELAQACLEEAPAGVLLVKPEHLDAFRSILACVNYSEASAAALYHAARVAAIHGARLCVLHVFEGPWRGLHYRAPTPETSPNFRKQYMDGLRDQLGNFVNSVAADAGNVTRDLVIVEGQDVCSSIVASASTLGAELVAVGLRKRTWLRRRLRNALAEHVARHTSASVLAVPSDDA